MFDGFFAFIMGNVMIFVAASMTLKRVSAIWFTPNITLSAKAVLFNRLYISRDCLILLLLSSICRHVWMSEPPPVWTQTKSQFLQFIAWSEIYASPLAFGMCVGAFSYVMYQLEMPRGGVINEEGAKFPVLPWYCRWYYLGPMVCIIGCILDDFLMGFFGRDEQEASLPDFLVIANIYMDTASILPQLVLMKQSAMNVNAVGEYLGKGAAGDDYKQQLGTFILVLAVSRGLRMLFWLDFMVRANAWGDVGRSFTFLGPDILHMGLIAQYVQTWKSTFTEQYSTRAHSSGAEGIYGFELDGAAGGRTGGFMDDGLDGL